MIASSFTSAELTVTCSEPGRTTFRSIDQRVAPSRYEPVISKLWAAINVPAAPVSRLRVVGKPRPNGRSHAERAARASAPTSPARTRSPALDRESGANTPWAVTPGGRQPLLEGDQRQAPVGAP